MLAPFQSALAIVREFELTLRRVARLELMRRHGRHWLAESRSLYDTIEPRILSDSKAGLFDTSSSELSYLTLSELSFFIFKQGWNTVFRDIFGGHQGYLADIQTKITPLRNKVAHFRSVKREDLFNARGISEMREQLREHYTASSLTVFHIQSDPCYSESWIDNSVVKEATNALRLNQHETIWGVIAEGEYLRKFGISLGLGIYNGHLFVEFFSDSEFPVSALDQHLTKNKESISFLSLNAEKLRVFYSLVNGERETGKLIRSLYRILGNSGNLKNATQDELSEVNEYFIGPNVPPTISFAL